MKFGIKVSAIAFALALVVAGFVVLLPRAQAQVVVPNGPWLDRVIFSQNADISQAVTDVLAGNNDLYYWGSLPETDKIRLRQSLEATPIIVLGRLDSLDMNPLPRDDGLLNPFTLREVREAMQYLVDRALMLREAAGEGRVWAAPFHPASADYGRFVDIMVQIEDKYANNPALAKDMITAAMTGAGATLNANGKWVDPNGVDLVKIIVFTRIEDHRIIYGPYVADLLDGMGFTVDNQLVDRTAITTVYFDPVAAVDGSWQLYPGGWGSPPNLFVDDGELFFSHGCNFEAWCETTRQDGTGYEPPAVLNDVYNALAFGEYSSFDERNALLRDALPLVNAETYRTWLFAAQELYPVNKRLDIGFDIFEGPTHLVTSRTAKVPEACLYDGAATACQAHFVNRLVGDDAWNPYAIEGVETYYDAVIREWFLDSGMIVHPHRGQWIDNRNAVVAETMGPTGTFSVPASALFFNTATNAWEAVGAGVTAVSKATVTPTFGAWHTDSPMTMDDIRVDISTAVRRQTGDIAAILPNAATQAAKTNAELIKAWEFTDTSYTIWFDFFNPDIQEIAAFGSVWPDAPWEVQELMVKGALDQSYALDKQDALNTAIPPSIFVELTKGPLSPSFPVLTADLAAQTTANAIPAGSGGFITAAEATQRWANLGTFVTNFGHFWPSNGPYILETLNPEFFSGSLIANRNYPFLADHYEALRVPAVPDIVLSAPDTVFSGTPGIFDFTSTVAGLPYDRISTIWFLKDLSTNELVAQGTSATQLGSGAYRIELPSSLTEQLLFGNFELITVVTGQDASPPVILKPAFLVLPSVAFLEGLVSATEGALRTDITALEDNQAALQGSIDSNTAATNGLVLLVTILAVLSVAAVAIAVVAVVRIFRGGGMGGGPT